MALMGMGRLVKPTVHPVLHVLLSCLVRRVVRRHRKSYPGCGAPLSPYHTGERQVAVCPPRTNAMSIVRQVRLTGKDCWHVLPAAASERNHLAPFTGRFMSDGPVLVARWRPTFLAVGWVRHSVQRHSGCFLSDPAAAIRAL